MTKKIEQMESDQPTLKIVPMSFDHVPNAQQKAIVALQLTMATSSINHEYASIEFGGTPDRQRQEELLGYMHDCRTKYLEAREVLERFDPSAVANFEQDLMKQKLETMTEYNA